jgi:isorenieratene synthase
MPADGGSTLIAPLVQKLCELGGQLEMDWAVTHIERAGDGWRVHGQAQKSGALQARQLILAADAANAEKIINASALLTPHTSAHLPLYWPRAMPTAIVRLWFDRLPLTYAQAGILSGEFVLDNYFWLDCLQESYIQWRKATGGSAIEAHIYGPPELLEESDALLLTRAIADVHSAFPELRGHLIHPFLRRNPATHTLFGLGPAERHLGTETPWPDLFCCGDWVRHPSPSFFLERACVTGIEAANAVLRSRQLPPWPLLPGPPPERLAHVLERLMRTGRRVLRRRRVR